MLVRTSTLSSRVLTLLLILMLVFLPIGECMLKCRYCIGNAKCDGLCTGERCLKTISQEGTVRRECINGSDPAFDFKGHKHTDDGEDAWICDDRDFCNSAIEILPGWMTIVGRILLRVVFMI
uniref:Uncharacterized protein n=1 Tax=Panagrolaimus sp. JU765 TaxID=591449 RepID=A0AC34QIK6_9BILA